MKHYNLFYNELINIEIAISFCNQGLFILYNLDKKI
jgi:hypothetical protein